MPGAGPARDPPVAAAGRRRYAGPGSTAIEPHRMLPATDGITWKHSPDAVGYPEALARMDAQVGRILAGTGGECVWLTEHPPLYTLGTSADRAEVLEAARLPVYATGRGGRVTYHGPGQRVAYVMLDLRRRGRDVRAYVGGLEAWIVAVLGDFGVRGRTVAGRVGVWVQGPGGHDAKIAAIGVRVRRGVTFHGVSLNVDPDLAHYDAIVPCGIRDAGVTSLRRVGVDASMADVDRALVRRFVDWVPPREPATDLGSAGR